MSADGPTTESVRLSNVASPKASCRLLEYDALNKSTLWRRGVGDGDDGAAGELGLMPLPSAASATVSKSAVGRSSALD
ncbi:hypothetical protein FS837_007874, partial [Tulasnella sp. UAMH 9824]